MSESKRITIVETLLDKNNDRIQRLEERAVKNETNITALQSSLKDNKAEQLRCTESTEELIRDVEIRILKEIAASEARTKSDITRIEAQLKNEIGDTRKDVVKIIENDLAHLKFDVDTHIHTGQKLNYIQWAGWAVGALSGFYIVIENGSAILQWLYNILDIFF